MGAGGSAAGAAGAPAPAPAAAAAAVAQQQQQRWIIPGQQQPPPNTVRVRVPAGERPASESNQGPVPL